MLPSHRRFTHDYSQANSEFPAQAWANAPSDPLRKTFFLVCDLERVSIFRPFYAMIANTGRRDVCVAEPFLDLGDVGFMTEGLVDAVARGAWAAISNPILDEYFRTSL